MNLNLEGSHLMIRELCRNFVATELAPNAPQLDRTAAFPQEIIRQCAQMGLLGMFVPSAYGGANLDRLSGAIAIEELAKGCASTALILSVHNSLVCGTLLKYGSESQKQKWLPKLATGEHLGCFCLTEHDAGSDAAAQRSQARLEGSSWVLNGSKTMITNAPEARFAIVFARSADSQGVHGISAFGVPMDAAGISVGPKDDKLGVRAASTASLTFENVRVPKENLVGQVGMGFYIAMSVLSCGRIGIAAQAVGIADAAYHAALKYAKQREQFGQPIANYQGIQWMLADMATEIEAARLLVYRAATAKQECQMIDASVAKLFASEMAMRVTDKAIQIHGGYGFIKDFPVERHYRDAKVTEIYAGTSEVQRQIVASRLLREGRTGKDGF